MDRETKHNPTKNRTKVYPDRFASFRNSLPHRSKTKWTRNHKYYVGKQQASLPLKKATPTPLALALALDPASIITKTMGNEPSNQTNDTAKREQDVPVAAVVPGHPASAPPAYQVVEPCVGSTHSLQKADNPPPRSDIPPNALPVQFENPSKRDAYPKGILYQLGAEGGKCAYNNPHAARKCEVTTSTVDIGIKDALVDNCVGIFVTQDEPSSWFQVPASQLNCLSKKEPSAGVPESDLSGISRTLRDWRERDCASGRHASVRTRPLTVLPRSQSADGTFQLISCWLQKLGARSFE